MGYEIGEQWKFEMPGKIYYTGTIFSKESKQIFIRTRKNEEQTINVDEILQSKKIGIGDFNGIGIKK